MGHNLAGKRMENMCDPTDTKRLHTLTVLAAAHLNLWLHRVFILERE